MSASVRLFIRSGPIYNRRMYISPKKHLLSDTLLLAALIRICGTALNAGIRLAMRSAGSLSPDMLNARISNAQFAVSALQLILVFAVMLRSYFRIRHMISVIPREDRSEIRQLQKEQFGDDISSLSAEKVSRLLEIWMTILVGAQSLYDVSAILYRDAVRDMADILSEAGGAGRSETFELYNVTHGFKYLSMFIAIMLGIMITGIFLRDRFLKISAVLISALFILCFAFVQMTTLSFLNARIGVVWTSVIFHVLETFGLLITAFYLRVRYNGV